jgi:sugar O-acyltransferase (sialic acid O-acetyltransferase NeuD family)
MIQTWTIFGAGNFLEDIIDCIEISHGAVAQVVLNQEVGIEISKPIKTFEEFTPYTDFYFFGFVSPNKENLLEKIWDKYPNISFANLIHPHAYISKTSNMGMGNYVGPGAVIGPKTQLGSFNYINRAASIGHHTKIEDFNHIGPSCTVCGRVNIGNKNYLGAASAVRDGICIKRNVKLGIGAIAVKDILEEGTYIGVPAKKLCMI